MVTRVVLNGSDFKQLLMGKSVYKDFRTGPLEIVLADETVSKVSEDRAQVKMSSKSMLLTGDDD